MLVHLRAACKRFLHGCLVAGMGVDALLERLVLVHVQEQHVPQWWPFAQGTDHGDAASALSSPMAGGAAHQSGGNALLEAMRQADPQQAGRTHQQQQEVEAAIPCKVVGASQGSGPYGLVLTGPPASARVVAVLDVAHEEQHYGGAWRSWPAYVHLASAFPARAGPDAPSAHVVRACVRVATQRAWGPHAWYTLPMCREQPLWVVDRADQRSAASCSSGAWDEAHALAWLSLVDAVAVDMAPVAGRVAMRSTLERVQRLPPPAGRSWHAWTGRGAWPPTPPQVLLTLALRATGHALLPRAAVESGWVPRQPVPTHVLEAFAVPAIMDGVRGAWRDAAVADVAAAGPVQRAAAVAGWLGVHAWTSAVVDPCACDVTQPSWCAHVAQVLAVQWSHPDGVPSVVVGDCTQPSHQALCRRVSELLRVDNERSGGVHHGCPVVLALPLWCTESMGLCTPLLAEARHERQRDHEAGAARAGPGPLWASESGFAARGCAIINGRALVWLSPANASAATAALLRFWWAMSDLDQPCEATPASPVCTAGDSPCGGTGRMPRSWSKHPGCRGLWLSQSQRHCFASVASAWRAHAQTMREATGCGRSGPWSGALLQHWAATGVRLWPWLYPPLMELRWDYSVATNALGQQMWRDGHAPFCAIAWRPPPVRDAWVSDAVAAARVLVGPYANEEESDSSCGTYASSSSEDSMCMSQDSASEEVPPAPHPTVAPATPTPSAVEAKSAAWASESSAVMRQKVLALITPEELRRHEQALGPSATPLPLPPQAKPSSPERAPSPAHEVVGPVASERWMEGPRHAEEASRVLAAVWSIPWDHESAEAPLSKRKLYDLAMLRDRGFGATVRELRALDAQADAYLSPTVGQYRPIGGGTEVVDLEDLAMHKDVGMPPCFAYAITSARHSRPRHHIKRGNRFWMWRMLLSLGYDRHTIKAMFDAPGIMDGSLRVADMDTSKSNTSCRRLVGEALRNALPDGSQHKLARGCPLAQESWLANPAGRSVRVALATTRAAGSTGSQRPKLPMRGPLFGADRREAAALSKAMRAEWKLGHEATPNPEAAEPQLERHLLAAKRACACARTWRGPDGEQAMYAPAFANFPVEFPALKQAESIELHQTDD